MIVRIPAVCCLFLAVVLVAGCITAPSPSVPSPSTAVSPTLVNAMQCSADSDCVPAPCCHPTGCINKAARKSCEDVICTLSCEGPVDCGAGSCGCVQGTCGIVSARNVPGGMQPAPLIRIDSSPQRYSPLMSSTPGIGLAVNASAMLPAAKYTWTADYGRFLSWNPPNYSVKEEGSTVINHGEKVYWTFIERPSSTASPVLITVTVRDLAGTVLGESVVTLAWDGDYAVVVKGTAQALPIHSARST